MLRQVRGLGTLIPSQEAGRQIPAETEATVVRIRMLPGAQVKGDSVLLEMSNPQANQAALDVRLQQKAADNSPPVLNHGIGQGSPAWGLQSSPDWR